MVNLQQINVETIKIPSDISKDLWNNPNVTKEKLTSYFKSKQYEYFKKGMLKGQFKDKFDFSDKLNKEFNSSGDREMNVAVEWLTFGEPIEVCKAYDGTTSVINGYHRIEVAQELGEKTLFVIIGK